MNWAVIRKTASDSLLLLFATMAGIFVFEIVFCRVVEQMPAELGGGLLSQKWVKDIVRFLLGADLTELFTSTGVMTIGFSNSIVYALSFIFLLTTCSRIVAGEVDRGTSDLLLALPISRIAVYASASLVWIVACVPLSLMPILGVYTGTHWFQLKEPVEYRLLWLPTMNLLFLFWAVGGISMLFSALYTRRGPAVGVVIAVLIFSLMINFLAQNWSDINKIAFLSLLNYYKPLPLVKNQALRWDHLAVLSGVLATTWAAGLIYFSRRDIPAA
ncbi:MAG: ABC transporter permease subunit [Phycisphaerales bacterium]|nr:ABC transporter permease subunit [Phycisphaerales bacterium]